MKNWLAVRVATGKEYQVRNNLKEANIDSEIYIPRRLLTDMIRGKIQQKTERLLPGYLLIGSEKAINIAIFDDFVQVIGPVTPDEVEHLRGLEYQEIEYMEPGVKIIVTEGPFAGCKGTVMNVDEEKVKCKLVFQGMELEIDMHPRYINSI